MSNLKSFLLLAERDLRQKPQDPHQLPHRLNLVLQRVEEKFQAEWINPPIQEENGTRLWALLRRPRHAFDIAVALSEGLWPLIYDWALARSQAPRNGLDSLSHHEDQAALEAASRVLSRGRADNAFFSLVPQTEEEALNGVLVTATARGHRTISQTWTEARRRVVNQYREVGHQGKTAEILGITQQSVSEALKAAKLRPLMENEAALRSYLDRIQ
ncbi:MAG: hypothetical protein DWQ01_00210 [Planctomycetota bacterium]|nr:MAG: hypothetical protein DWQ01_00210 [Planctomycetota bacterium]